MPALVFSIDGPDFTGKTTIANLLVEILRERFHDKDVLFKRTELPSSLVTGIFTKILRNSSDKVSSKSFALSYALDHLHHFENYIKPMKESKQKIVIIQERSLLSTWIYQGIVGDVDFEWLKEINKFDKNFPDLTLILKVDSKELLKRKSMENREFDKFEVEEHLKKIIDVYYNLPENLKKQFNVEYVEANDSPMSIAKRCTDVIEKKIKF
ncbi:MAG: dTMP kinase [Candidatus Aenigmatarchaeota archaeon]